VLSNAFEYSLPNKKAEAKAKAEMKQSGAPAQANMDSRFLGLIVIPKHQIAKIEVEERRDELASATQAMSIGGQAV
jgi:hypothetical protein